MKKGVITLLIIAGVAMAIFFACKNGYNNMVLKQETVAAQWSNVENQYQRRLDLIPNLVNTVKGYASHESETLTAVIEARAQATRTNISIDELNEHHPVGWCFCLQNFILLCYTNGKRRRWICPR
ncbi:MAG: LemA family protein, partial [Rikenellaceae bacterium]|nr:LemA family protein [Rikenellaceae bacterium]